MKSEQGNVSEIVEAWAEDPEVFIREALKVESLSTQQRTACKEIKKLVWSKIKARYAPDKLTDEEREYSKKVGISIMSGKGTGKDALAAMIIIWWLCCFERPLIPCTAPTGHQLKDVLWSEISKWLMGKQASPPVVREWLTWQTDRVFLTDSKGREWFAVARTSNPRDSVESQEETLQGFHSDFMMMVIDEASGVSEPVFKPLESTLTGLCNFILMIFNPTKSVGFAVDSHRKERERWVCLQWNAEESELVSRESIEDKAKKYGKDSNYYRVNVLGIPPIAGDDILIPYEWVVAATDRDLEPMDDDPEVAGVDVGAGGDPTIYLRLQGPKILGIESLNSASSEEVTNWIMGKILRYEPKAVFVDNLGVGWGVVGELQKRLRSEDITITGVNVGEPAMNDEKFFQLRDELCWRVRERFERGTISIPNDPLLIGETTTIKYKDDHNGKLVKVESKRDMRKRGLLSPNRFDALMLAHYYETTFVREWHRRFRHPDRPEKGQAGSWRVV